MADPIATPPTSVTPPVQPVTSQDAPLGSNPTLEQKQSTETISALNKLFDESVPPTSPVSPVVADTNVPTQKGTDEPTKPATTPIGTESDFQKKLDNIKPPAGAHPNVAAGIEQLKKEATTEHTRAEQLQTQLKEAQAKLTEFETKSKEPAKLPENVEKELNMLRERVREMDYTVDPEFQNNFVKPVQQAEGEIMGLLKTAGAKDETLKWIAERGGLVAMSQSMEKAGNSQDPDMTLSDWVENVLLAKTPSVFRNRIQNKLTTAADLIDKGQNVIQDFKTNSQERYQQKVKQQVTLFEEGKNAAIASLGDAAKPIEVKADFTPEQRADAEAHNGRLKQAEVKFAEYSQKAGADPKIAAEILVKATQADVVTAYNQKLLAQVAELTDKYNRLKSAGGHSRAGDSAPPIGTEKPSMGSLLKTDTNTAMNDLFKTVSPGT